LADGDVSVALTVTVDKVSKQAADKIAKAGGSITQ
jgi:ribosomal protein L15